MIEDRIRTGLHLFNARYGAPTALVAAGGVASNQTIRKALHGIAFDAKPFWSFRRRSCAPTTGR